MFGFKNKKESFKDEMFKKSCFLKQNDTGESIFNFLQQLFKGKQVAIRKDNNANGIFLIFAVVNGFNINFSVNLSKKDEEITVDFNKFPKTDTPIRYYSIKLIREMYAEVAKVLDGI